MDRYLGVEDLTHISIFAYHGKKAGAAEKIVRAGLFPVGEYGERTHIHLVEEICGGGRDQPGVRQGSTHVVVVLLRQFATDCCRLAPGSLVIWKSHNNVYLTEGKMPLNFNRDDGEVAVAEGV